MNADDRRTGRWLLGVTFCLVCLSVYAGAVEAGGLSSGEGGRQQADLPVPKVNNDDLVLSLFASEPEIVTPIGVAVGRHDRIYVLESHTHLESDDYPGPASDRVKVFSDSDRDGAADGHHIFAKGIENGMNLAFSPQGTLFVVTSRAVWALYDRDGDGRSEDRKRIAGLTKPEYVYDHAALMGVTFSRDGWLYITRGNVGGDPWRMEAADGSSVSGFGDGGNIMRCRPDGTDLQKVATGFWNPFDVAFDLHGRLLASDNDPDSRGPNRLVHVISGGDYGYKALYGGSGIHPYLAWDGELPGTLPYAAPLGEAVSGILPTGYAALPSDYPGDVLAAVWEENTIVGIDLQQRGVSVRGEPQVLIQGGDRFHPVSMAADSHGAVYITDWVVRQYPNHGKGRIWRMAPKKGVKQRGPRRRYGPVESDPGRQRLEKINNADEKSDFGRLKSALTSQDPFVRSAAITVLSRAPFQERVLEATESSDPEVRLGALLALHRSGIDEAKAVAVAKRLLADPKRVIRRMALIWVGRRTMTTLRPDLARSINQGEVTSGLFETYLATVRHLRPSFVEAYASQDPEADEELELPDGFIPKLLKDASRSRMVRAVALEYLEEPEAHLELVLELAERGNGRLALEAIRTLAGVTGKEVVNVLTKIAESDSSSPKQRAEALLVLSRQPAEAVDQALGLLERAPPVVQLAAARYLRSRSLSQEAKQALRKRKARLRQGSKEEAIAQQLDFALGSSPRQGRPSSNKEWYQALAEGGDPSVGRRVFYSPLAQCSRCHAIGNRGGYFGPNLTGVGRSKSRRQLIDAILQPSERIAPGWQTWYVKTENGRMHYGRQIDVHYDDVEIYVQSDRGGEFETFEDVSDYGVVETSLMPEGLERQLTVSDFRSLIAFLKEKH